MVKLLVAISLVVGCKHYDRDKLLAVCSDGADYDAAAAYDPNAAANPYPLAMAYKSAGSPSWFLSTPERFQAATAAPSADNYKDVALALCIEQQPGPFDRDCDMDSFDSTMELGGDTPKVETHKSGRGPAKIKAYGSHYVLTMREAKTAKVVATRTLDVKVEHCPLVVLGDKVEDYVDIADDDLVGFAASALPKPVAAKLSAPLR